MDCAFFVACLGSLLIYQPNHPHFLYASSPNNHPQKQLHAGHSHICLHVSIPSNKITQTHFYIHSNTHPNPTKPPHHSMRGGELFQHITTEGQLEEGYTQTIMRQVLSGLSFLHSQQIAHLDIKVRRAVSKNYFLVNCFGELFLEVI